MKTTNQNPGLRNRSEQWSTRNKMPRLDFALRHKNRQLPTPKLLELLQVEAPDFRNLAQIVGQWVWIQFKDKQPSQVTSALSQLGFHWNKRRQTWQHPCGVFCPRGSASDPRSRYQVCFLTHA